MVSTETSHPQETVEPQPGSPLRRLMTAAHQFDFFQAVRLLTISARQAASSRQAHRKPIGRDADPRDEIVRFGAIPAHTFPQGPIASFQRDPDDLAPPTMRLAFLGLTGPHGVLPAHYTQLVIDRTRQKDGALRDFLDLFNHRTASLFYRAWAKYRLPVSHEDAALQGQEDTFAMTLFGLIGWGHSSLRGRLELDDDVFAHYSGHFCHAPRNAVSLEGIISEYFALPARVRQLYGQWLHLDPADQSQMAGGHRGQLNNCLGRDVVVGERVWGVENNFRLLLGPLSYSQFLDLTPAGSALQALGQLVRSYVGPTMDFEVQLILRRDEVPPSQLASAEAAPKSRLGWNTWVHAGPVPDDVDDAVFVTEGLPTKP